MSRLFTFGCSFTNYRWSTWADCLAPEFDYFENWGQSGGGNHYIFNSVMEADQRHKFGAGDTVVVCWTSVMREDRYIKNRWVTLGNIMTTPIFTKEFITDAVCERGNLIRDLAFIKAVREILNSKSDVTWRFLGICPIVQIDLLQPVRYQSNDLIDLYKDVIDSIEPSFIDILGHNFWNSNTEKRFCHLEDNNTIDHHPTPEEHLTYLDAVLPGWVTKQETRVKITEESIYLNKDPRKTSRRPGMTRIARL